MQNRYLYLFCLIMAIADIAVVNLAFFIALSVYGSINNLHYRDFAIIVNLTWFICSNIVVLYHKKTVQKNLFMINTLKCICLHLIFFLVYMSGTKGLFITSRFLMLFYTSLSFILLSGRFCASILSPLLKKKFKMGTPIALMGVNPTSIQLADYFKKNEKLYNFAGFLNSSNCLAEHDNTYTSVVIEDQMRRAVEAGINEVYVSLAPDRVEEIDNMVKEANKQCIRLKFVPDFSKIIHKPLNIDAFENLLIINLTGVDPQEKIHSRFEKRLFDVIFSLFVLIFILSWIYPIIAILIKLESRGPVVFRQGRSGRNNVDFWCYKFRSMRVNQDSHNRQASKNDDRVTKVGRILRKTSLDELPQFINVLIGNMSVVGPRPHMLKHTEQYRHVIDKYMVRHYLKPGITGWAQINGLRGETQRLELMEKRVQADIWYLENLSTYLDIKIIFLTVFHVLKGHKNAF